MIHKETKDAVLKALGKGHISKIDAFVREQGVTKANGESYSPSMISMVLRGLRESPNLEEAIVACAEHYVKQQEKKTQRIESLVKKIKAVH